MIKECVKCSDTRLIIHKMPFLKQCYAIWRGLESACHGWIAIRAIRGFRTSGVGPIVSHSPSGYLRGDRGSSQLSTVGHRLAVISKAVFLQLKAEPIIHEVSFWNDVTGSISPDGSTELVAHPVSLCGKQFITFAASSSTPP